MTDDESEEPTKAQLWNRIRQLEQAVYPNRREILKAGAAAAAGGAAVAAGGSASAGSASTGQVGTQSDPVDAYVEDLYDHNGNQPLSLPGDGTVNATTVDADTLLFNLQQYQTVTGSRSFGTWETNTTSHPLHVLATGLSDNTVDAWINLRPHVNTSQTDNELRASAMQTSDGTRLRMSVGFIVPPGHDYKVDLGQSGSGASMDNWQEANIGGNGN